MLKMILRQLDERVLFPARLNYLTKWLVPHLSNVETALDLGASDGRLAHRLSQHLPVKFSCCDVFPQEKQFLPVIKCEATSLPFPDNTFDCVLLIDVLHHDLNPSAVVAEAVRVSRGTVLIKDHFWENRLDFFGLQVMDYIGNAPYDISLPYNYLTSDQWYRLAQDHRLEVKSEQRFRYNLIDPCRHIVLKLNKAVSS